jgi:hypothetical protein
MLLIILHQYENCYAFEAGIDQDEMYQKIINVYLVRRSWMEEPDHLPDFNQMMDDVIKWSNANNRYPFCQSITHNLLLMGKTRTGKTTVAKVLENPYYIPPDARLFSETNEVTIHPVATTINYENIIYCFNVIDTPGMFDRVKKRGSSLSNERIKAAIDTCMTQDVTNIHLFAFVINLHSNVDAEDIEAMIFVKNHYPLLHQYVCLLVTHCEESTWEQREMKVNEFFDSQKLIKHDMKDFFGGKIFYMGSLRPELRNHPNKQCVRQQIKNVHYMRDTLLEYIINLDVNDSFNIHRVSMNNSCAIL